MLITPEVRRAWDRGAGSPAGGDSGQQGRWTVVRLAGEGLRHVRFLLAAVLDERAAASARPRVAVDASGLRFCDTSGLRCLVLANRRVRASVGELVVVDAGPVRLRHKPWIRGLTGDLDLVDELPA